MVCWEGCHTEFILPLLLPAIGFASSRGHGCTAFYILALTAVAWITKQVPSANNQLCFCAAPLCHSLSKTGSPERRLPCQDLGGRWMENSSQHTPQTLQASGNGFWAHQCSCCFSNSSFKCEFSGSSVSFLGYIIESGKVATDPEKIRAVAEWPIPTTCKQIQRFLCFAPILLPLHQDCSRVAASLTRLSYSFTLFSWTL